MNDPNVFTDFITNVLGETIPRNRDMIISFITTFSELITTSEQEIDTFVTNVHSSNSGRANNSKIVISPNTTIGLKAIRFELKDRLVCNALPTVEIIQAININELNILRQSRSKAMEAEKNRNNNEDNMTIVKFKGRTNYDEFMTSFTTLIRRKYGSNKIPLDYLLRPNQAPANYNALYSSREDKLKSCIALNGDAFRTDNETLYSLYVEHIGTTGIGSSVVNRHASTQNGRRCHLDFILHYNNATHLENNATDANASIDKAVYLGTRRNFTIETYYSIFSEAFNTLNRCGPAHHLSEAQKIQKFESGLKEPEALRFAVLAKKEWDNLPIIQQTFDTYFNLFSADLSKLQTLTDDGTNRGHRRISNLNTNNNPNDPNNQHNNGFRPPFNRGGRGRGRGRGRGYFRGGRGGRFGNRNGRLGGRGRGQRDDNSRYFAPLYGNFKPEPKIYTPSVFNNLTSQQKNAIGELKQSQGWINQMTPPPGFTIDSNTGYAVPSQSIISAIQTASINQMNTPPPMHLPSGPPSIIQLPPPPPPRVPPPPPPQSNPNGNAGANFSRSGTRARDSSSVISAVSINGQPYTGRVYDNNGNALN
jgi:hypothetical protein